LEAIRDAELDYRLVADFIYDWEYWEAPDGSLHYVSPSCQRITGYPAEHFVREPQLLHELIIPEDKEAWSEHRHTAKDAETAEVQFRIRTREGEIRWIEHVCQPVTDESGAFWGYRASNRDITKRKQAEDELQKHREHLERLVEERTAELAQVVTKLQEEIDERKLAEREFHKLSRAVAQSPSVVVITDVDGQIEYVNPKFSEITGYSVEEVLGQNPRILKSNQHPLDLYEELWSTVLAGKEWRGELINRKKDGELYWESASISPVKDARGTTTHFVKVAEDISQRKKTENALRESEEKFRNLAEQSPNMIFINQGGRVVYANRKCEEVMGYTREEFYAPDFDFLSLVAPEYLDLVTTSLHKHMQGEDVPPYEYALVTKDGERLETILAPKVITYRGDWAILGTVTDITTQKKAEEALKRERDFSSTILNTVDSLVIVLDTQGRIVTFNRACEECSGYSLDEVKGKPFWNILLLPEEREAVMAMFGNLTADEPSTRYENHWLTKDGRRRLIAWSNSALADASGAVEHVISTGLDITERRQAELQLHEAMTAAEIAQHQEKKRRQEAERRRQIAESLGHVLAALNSNQSLDEILDFIVDQAANLFDNEAVAIYSVRNKSSTVTIQAGRGLPTGYVAGSDIPVGQDALHQALSYQQPVAIRDVAATLVSNHGVELDAEWQAMIAPWVDLYETLLAVPIVIEDETYGGILLCYAEPGEFSDEDVELAQVFGAQVALAIENARLRDQVQQAAATAERARLARDLHDAVTQTIFSASLIAEALPRIWEHHPDEGRRGLEELRQLTRGALAEMRALLLELRPAALTEKPLGDLLRSLTQAVTSRTRVPVTLVVEGNSSLPANVQIAMYRIAQEALNNVAKHASANRVAVNLHCQPREATLRIHDDGTGFDQNDILPNQLGVSIMRERAESIGASLQLDSQAGHGTQVVVHWQDNEEKNYEN
jgi:PAS domain S-box-containing protein